jgi:hypothetical protein
MALLLLVPARENKNAPAQARTEQNSKEQLFTHLRWQSLS